MDYNEHMWTLTFDGGASPNPGIASCAFKAESGVDKDGKSKTISKNWKMDGIHTSNEAEWNAVATGVEAVVAADPGAVLIKVIGDSQLVIFQIQGIYRVKSHHLRKYNERIQKVRDINDIEILPVHVEREMNTEMDAACKAAR